MVEEEGTALRNEANGIHIRESRISSLVAKDRTFRLYSGHSAQSTGLWASPTWDEESHSRPSYHATKSPSEALVKRECFHCQRYYDPLGFTVMTDGGA